VTRGGDVGSVTSADLLHTRHDMPPRIARRLAAALLLVGSAACRSATAPGGESGAVLRAPTGETVLAVEVAPQRVTCVGVDVQQCLQVRPAAGAPWQLFYDHVEGFDFEPGFRYRLLVARRPVADPPADASSVAYRLLAVLEKRPA
jgi:hypothetical protein